MTTTDSLIGDDLNALPNKLPSSRHQVRCLLLQALYQHYYAQHGVEELEQQFEQHTLMESSDSHYFRRLLYGVIEHIEELDQAFEPLLAIPLKDVTAIELSALRLATYELIYCRDVPYKVVINEALELTKQFGSQEGFKFVNGVLHPLARQLRAEEISPSSSS